MLRSTISTGSYILQKYSRSYPSNTSSQTQSQDQVADWQHFTNPPVLTLTLDVKKSADNKLFESVRLRIIWNLDEGGQREIIMEDLDLLSFSGLDYSVHSSQGLPLKAVHRGSDVGIRYQHPLNVPATSPNSYRRFQVNFGSASDAAQFIDTIRPVCPCKENAGPPLPPPVPRMPMNRLPIPRSASVIQAAPESARAPLARHHTVVAPQQRPLVPPLPPSAAGGTTPMEHAHHHYAANSQEEPLQNLPPPPPRFLPSSSSDLSLAPLSSSSSDPAAPISVLDTSSQPSSSLLETPSRQFATAQSKGHHNNGPSLPPSSQPTSSASTLAPTPPSSLSQDKTPGAGLEYLLDAPGLYGMTRPELDNLVGVVMREPGFPKLLEELESMLVNRGLIGR